jgi:hypothetical protein
MKEEKMSINVKSVITSGLVSGLIINLSAIGMVPLVGNEMDLVLASLGLPPLSNMAMFFFSMISFINGVFLVLLYAIVKNQFGPGIKTAVIVSFVFWFLTYFFANASLVAYGFMPVKLTVIGTVWGLGELLLAGIVGSKLYKAVEQK